MVLDEVLRSRIDEVARRRKVTERLHVGGRGFLALLMAFVALRATFGLFTGGQGGSLAFALALTVGITYALASPRQHYTRITAARFIDTQLKLSDRLATSVERATLENSSPNPVERCLFIDAAKHASDIHPVELVPYHLPVQIRWVVPLLIIGVLLSLPIYPKGLSWQFGGARLQQAAKRADELIALAEQLKRMSVQQPELRRLADELQQAGEQLRDKRLPQGEALRMLRELEKGLQQEALGGRDGGSGEIDISQIQGLAERLRQIDDPSLLNNLAKQARNSSGTGTGQPGSESDEYGDSTGNGNKGSNSRRSSSSNRPTNSDQNAGEDGENEAGDNQNTTGDGNRSNNTGGNRSGNNNDTNNRGNTGSGDNGDPSGNETGIDDATGQSGSQAGTEKGSNASMDYNRLQDTNKESVRISGKIGSSGQLYSSSAPGSITPGKTNTRRTTGASANLTPGSVERAVEQESIPLAYRRWIKDYFAALEPGSAK